MLAVAQECNAFARRGQILRMNIRAQLVAQARRWLADGIVPSTVTSHILQSGALNALFAHAMFTFAQRLAHVLTAPEHAAGARAVYNGVQLTGNITVGERTARAGRDANETEEAALASVIQLHANHGSAPLSDAVTAVVRTQCVATREFLRSYPRVAEYCTLDETAGYSRLRLYTLAQNIADCTAGPYTLVAALCVLGNDVLQAMCTQISGNVLYTGKGPVHQNTDARDVLRVLMEHTALCNVCAQHDSNYAALVYVFAYLVATNQSTQRRTGCTIRDVFTSTELSAQQCLRGKLPPSLNPGAVALTASAWSAAVATGTEFSPAARLYMEAPHVLAAELAAAAAATSSSSTTRPNNGPRPCMAPDTRQGPVVP